MHISGNRHLSTFPTLDSIKPQLSLQSVSNVPQLQFLVSQGFQVFKVFSQGFRRHVREDEELGEGDITSVTSLSEDTFVNFIARHRTIIFISNLWVILETLLCHHTTVRRKVLTFYIWRLCLTVPAFLLSEEENIQEELGPGSGTCSLCLWTQPRTMEDREKKPFCTMAGLKHSFLPLQLHLNPSCLANSTCTLNF